MGLIGIRIDGSFPSEFRRGVSFSAVEHGHADAVAQAIRYLADEVLPASIALDHELHEQGHEPKRGFRRVS